LVGKATRLAQFLDKDEKEYEATIRFGWETDTGDRLGTLISEIKARNEEIVSRLMKTDWNELLEQFCGEIEQIPPMYSAKKVAGKKLYELARKGIEIERDPVKISISKLETVDKTGINDPQNERRIRVACSAGTYIRTLAADIGREVGTGAHLTELRRIRAGRFEIGQSITLEDLSKADDPTESLLPISMAVSHLPAFELPEGRVEKTRNGMSTRIFGNTFNDGEMIRMNDENGELISVGYFKAAENAIQPKVVLG
jgi:tRNA pseudouridine55 synthase